jgi:serine/threonine-protein kinase RsbW
MAERPENDPVARAKAATMNLHPDPAAPTTREVSIPSDPAEARRVQEEIEHLLQKSRFTDHEIFGIKLAIEEALVNAIKHGNQMDRTKTVRIRFTIRYEHFEIHIADEGPGFDPCDVPDPTAVENLERPCGRGLMLMKHYMNEVVFCDGGNAVRMSKVSKNGQKT